MLISILCRLLLAKMFGVRFISKLAWECNPIKAQMRVESSVADLLTNAYITFTFMLLAGFIQSDLQCSWAIHCFCQYMCSLGIEPTTFCAANTMLYHWAIGTIKVNINWMLLEDRTSADLLPESKLTNTNLSKSPFMINLMLWHFTSKRGNSN